MAQIRKFVNTAETPAESNLGPGLTFEIYWSPVAVGPVKTRLNLPGDLPGFLVLCFQVWTWRMQFCIELI